MIHVFSYRDKNYIYDVGSGSLHECDGATADFLRAREEGQDVDISYISDEQIKEILADVEGLKAQGFCFGRRLPPARSRAAKSRPCASTSATIAISAAAIALRTRAPITPNGSS